MTAYIRISTTGSAPFYFPVLLNVYNITKSVFNLAPFFTKTPKLLVNGIAWHPERNMIYEYKVKLSRPVDDHRMMKFMNISSDNFGELRYSYETYSQQQPVLIYKIGNILEYNETTTELTIKFKDYQDASRWLN